MSDFGKYLRETRKGVITQRELANKVGIGYPYISKIENNIEPPPSDDVLIKLALTIGVDIDEMFIQAGKIPKDLKEIILGQPQLFKLLKTMKKNDMVSFLIEHFEELDEQKENIYWNLFNKNDKCMLLIDPETLEIVNANAAATRFYNYSLKQLTNIRITDINTLSKEEVKEEIQKAKSKFRNYFNFKHRLNNDKVVAVKVKSSPVIIGNKIYLNSTVQQSEVANIQTGE